MAPTRPQLFRDRISLAYGGLKSDIELWELHYSTRDNNQELYHHITQFKNLTVAVYRHLPGIFKREYDIKDDNDDDLLTFKAAIIGGFTSQWLLLQKILNQRVAGSPYMEPTGLNLKQELRVLDTETRGYYFRLRAALPKGAQSHVPMWPPLVHLGRLAQLTLLQDDAPAVLSIPLSAVYEDKFELGTQAIPHEIGHAVFGRIPDFFPELHRAMELYILTDLSGSTQEIKQRKTLFRMFMNWIMEIVPDLAGTALGGQKFVESAEKLMIGTSAAMAGVTASDHPVAIIRPYIHNHFYSYLLKYLATSKVKSDDAISATARSVQPIEHVDSLLDTLLNARFESMPSLTPIKMSAVRDELIKFVDVLLDRKLDSLDQQSLKEVLTRCHLAKTPPEEPWEVFSKKIAETSDEAFNWGKITRANTKWVLEFPDPFNPVHATPRVSHLGFCCDHSIWFCC